MRSVFPCALWAAAGAPPVADAPRVILVGHCLPDRFLLSRAVRKASETAQIDHANTDDALERSIAKGPALLLVNRALDGRFGAPDGLGLITAYAGRAACMLVSNFPEAQRAAEAAGALPGFGKRELGRAETAALLREALGGP